MTYDSEYQYAPQPVLASGEAILWRGKPQKKGFVATKSLTMMPIAIVWLIFDLNFFSMAGGGGSFFLIPFLLLHMMPVWIWLGNVITAGRRWKNTAYYVTNRRIIIQEGFLAVNETSLFYKDIRNTQVRIGFLDKLFGTGDILFDTGMYNSKHNRVVYQSLDDLENPHEAYSRIQKIVLDMQTDIEYPNAYRPAENPGYNTQYRP